MPKASAGAPLIVDDLDIDDPDMEEEAVQEVQEETQDPLPAVQEDWGDEAPLEILYLLPADLIVLDEYNMRPWSSKQQLEDTEIEALAKSMDQDGQIHDVLIAPMNAGDDEAGFFVLSGTRRRRAATLINERREQAGVKTGEGLFRLRCRVDRTGQDLKRKAFQANKQSEKPTPLDMAMLMRSMRAEYGQDAKGTGEIGRVLGVSKLTVTQHERLLGDECSEVVREQVQAGRISLESALELMKLGSSKQPPVVERARRIQVEKAVGKVKEQARRELKRAQKKADPVERREAAKQVKEREGMRVKEVKEKADKRVEAPAVREAIREREPEAGVKRTLADVKALFHTGKAGLPKGGAKVEAFRGALIGWLNSKVQEGVVRGAWVALSGGGAVPKSASKASGAGKTKTVSNKAPAASKPATKKAAKKKN